MAMSFVGTPLYTAPEVLKGLRYNYQADLWSIGCILYEMVTGIHPFPAKNHAQLINLATIGLKALKIEDQNLSNECESVLKKLICPILQERIHLEQLEKEPFVVNAPTQQNIEELIGQEAKPQEQMYNC